MEAGVRVTHGAVTEEQLPVISVVQKLVISASLGKSEDHHQRQKQGEQISAAAIAEQFVVTAFMVVRGQVHCLKPQIKNSYKEVFYKNSG
ncbi:hypothetical protein [Endozoicomonas atrinae]|uniref:hypothetical protein n=1 Tax=Endozoicomonas atrinae TaxID=1333660 RepID=UPI003B00F5FB